MYDFSNIFNLDPFHFLRSNLDPFWPTCRSISSRRRRLANRNHNFFYRNTILIIGDNPKSHYPQLPPSRSFPAFRPLSIGFRINEAFEPD